MNSGKGGGGGQLPLLGGMSPKKLSFFYALPHKYSREESYKQSSKHRVIQKILFGHIAVFYIMFFSYVYIYPVEESLVVL